MSDDRLMTGFWMCVPFSYEREGPAACPPSFDRADPLIGIVDEPQPRPQNHAALGPQAGQAADGARVVSLAAIDCAGLSNRVRSRTGVSAVPPQDEIEGERRGRHGSGYGKG